MFLCRYRGSRGEAQPADDAEPPAGRGGTGRGAFRGKKNQKKKNTHEIFPFVLAANQTHFITLAA